MTYEERIINYMISHKGITVKECIDIIGTTELRKLICNIKDKGWIVLDTWEEGCNRFDDQVRYKRYFLAGRKGE